MKPLQQFRKGWLNLPPMASHARLTFFIDRRGGGLILRKGESFGGHNPKHSYRHYRSFFFPPSLVTRKPRLSLFSLFPPPPPPLLILSGILALKGFLFPPPPLFFSFFFPMTTMTAAPFALSLLFPPPLWLSLLPLTRRKGKEKLSKGRSSKGIVGPSSSPPSRSTVGKRKVSGSV